VTNGGSTNPTREMKGGKHSAFGGRQIHIRACRGGADESNNKDRSDLDTPPYVGVAFRNDREGPVDAKSNKLNGKDGPRPGMDKRVKS
jgi:hypothetical protein